MTTTESSELTERPRRFLRIGLLWLAPALAIPISYYVVATHSGENHFGQGLKGSWFWPVFQMAQALSFFGFLCAPWLSSQSISRKWIFSFLGLLAFLADQFLSFLFIAFGMFPD